MAMSLNRAQIIGNVTRDPEMKQIPGGQVVTSFGIATNLTWTDQSGQKQEKVEFHNIVAWRKLAEICGQYLKKGSKVFIEGKLQTRSWEAEDGSKRYRTEIVADNMIMLDRKGDAPAAMAAPMAAAAAQAPHAGIDQAPAPTAETEATPAVAQAAPAKEEDVSIDDLPF
ncbi:single-stranded DNA-binding protein [Patescibacteria group bacterium]